MNRQKGQFVGRLLLAALLAAAMAFQSFAASARIAFSDPSAQVGQEVNVTMKFTSTDGQLLGDTKVTLDYDAGMLEYIGGSDNVSGGTGKLVVRGASGKTEVVTEMKFKALRSGTASITVSDWEGYDNNGQVLSEVKTGSSAVTIQGLETSSEDATLQSLQISPGTLDPAFTPATENYTATVGLDTENLAVSAVPNNEGATVALEGDSGLQEGENTVVCRVTAADGATVKAYTILVNKVEGGENNGEASLPEAAPEVLAELSSQVKKVQIVSLPAGTAVPEGLKESEITIGSAKVTGWVPESETDPEYCVFYCVNENGEQSFYRYDRKEKTLQRYFDDGAKVDPELLAVGEKYNELVDDYNLLKWGAIGGGGAMLVLILILLILLVSSRRSRSYGESVPRRENAREQGNASRVPGRRMTREERYMRGEEEDFEEEEEDFEDEIPVEAYQPEPAGEDSLNYRQERPAREPEQKRRAPVVDMEKTLAASLAREAAAMEEKPSGEPDKDDFEFFDLDE